MQRANLSAALLLSLAPALHAQSGTMAPRAATAYSYSVNGDGERDRAMLGVTTGSSGKRDTLGLLVESVTSGSPAEKAGIEEGNRIASINGVSLKLAREDAGESDMSGVMANRLTREMRKIKAGDEVTLQLWTGGSYKSVKIKTVTAEELSPAKRERLDRSEIEERAVVGISLGSNGSKRDSAGVFVSAVTDDGPADKAGIGEGDRIASINGVDLRVPREDLGDGMVAGARVSRLQREVAKAKAGQVLDLVVVSGGKSRSVKVTTIKAKDLPHNGGSYMIHFGDGPGMSFGPMGGTVLATPQLRREIEQEATQAAQAARVQIQAQGAKMRGELDQMRSRLQNMRVTAPVIWRRVII
jgi:S1-C subfamily serine protease